MSVLKLTLPDGELAVTGKQVSFRAPCNCSEVTGIKIGETTYSIVDASDIPISNLGDIFCKDALVSVLLDNELNKAFLLNPSNAYLGDIDTALGILLGNSSNVS